MRATASTLALLRRLSRKRAVVGRPDPADHGTAFGLDMSLAAAVGTGQALADVPVETPTAEWLERLRRHGGC